MRDDEAGKIGGACGVSRTNAKDTVGMEAPRNTGILRCCICRIRPGTLLKGNEGQIT